MAAPFAWVAGTGLSGRAGTTAAEIAYFIFIKYFAPYFAPVKGVA